MSSIYQGLTGSSTLRAVQQLKIFSDYDIRYLCDPRKPQVSQFRTIFNRSPSGQLHSPSPQLHSFTLHRRPPAPHPVSLRPPAPHRTALRPPTPSPSGISTDARRKENIKSDFQIRIRFALLPLHYTSDENCMSAFKGLLEPSTTLGCFSGSNYFEVWWKYVQDLLFQSAYPYANRGVHMDLKSYCLQTFQKQQPKRNDNYKSKTKSRTSTLMKPTASQLAKQNQERLINLSRYVTDTKQQANFIHKAPKRVRKDIFNCLFNLNI
ncbi:hypothetical protein LXL04_004865 [Taraxacum kok-saghyz]